jgi:hypothetical protein
MLDLRYITVETQFSDRCYYTQCISEAVSNTVIGVLLVVPFAGYYSVIFSYFILVSQINIQHMKVIKK